MKDDELLVGGYGFCREQDVDTAVAAVHSAFGLDAEKPEAVVYGGTGR